MTSMTEGYTSTYVFSAEQQEEVKKIYRRYVPQKEVRKASAAEDEKMARLRALDKSVGRHGLRAAALFGGVGLVIHGVGTTLVQGSAFYIPGTAIALLGVLLLFLTYPAYNYCARKQREKVEAEILSLCRELMK